MTAEEWVNINWPAITNDANRDYFVNVMKEYARLCCDEQKQICSEEAETNEYYSQGTVYVNRDSILNSPYPTQLQ